MLNRQSEATAVVPGSFIVYTDEVGKRHNAMVTTIHGEFFDGPTWTEEHVEAKRREAKDRSPSMTDEQVAEWYPDRLVGVPHTVPCINLVYVVSDESKTDSYGRQIERKTSVQHRSQTTAHGFYWENV